MASAASTTTKQPSLSPDTTLVLQYLARHRLSSPLSISSQCKMEEQACNKILRSLLALALVESQPQQGRVLWSATATGMVRVGVTEKMAADAAAQESKKKRGQKNEGKSPGAAAPTRPRRPTREERFQHDVNRVYEFLTNNPMSHASDVADGLDMPKFIVYKVLRALRDKGDIESCAVWRVASPSTSSATGEEEAEPEAAEE